MDSTADIADGANRVYIIDGNLSGTVRSIVAQDVNGTRVFLVQNDKIVGESQADQHGKFQFANVDAGAYDFVAAGPAGFAAIGVQAVVQEEAKNAAESVVQAVSDTNVVVEGGTQAAPAQEVDAALTPAADGQVVAQNVEEVKDAYGDAVVANEFAPGSEFETCAEDISCGGAMGGYGCGCESDYMGGGGCGGFGGLGDIGGLARAIVAGWVLTELIDNIDFNNDDDNPNPPGPISPR
jgi:hypothetical protein